MTGNAARHEQTMLAIKRAQLIDGLRPAPVPSVVVLIGGQDVRIHRTVEKVFRDGKLVARQGAVILPGTQAAGREN